MTSPNGAGRPRDKLILIVGATGDLGGLITRGLLSKGEHVRVLVRSQSSFQPLIEAGAQAVFGDLKDRNSLDPACKGVDVLITTATSAKRSGADTVDTVDLKGNQNLIDAAKFTGVKQFIFVSANIAYPDSPIPLMAAKAATEDYLRASGIPYTIVAPDAFMQVWVAMVVGLPAVAGKPVMFVGSGNRRHSFISDSDVANFIIASIENQKAISQKVVIGGPEALSFIDAVRVFERALNRKIAVQSVAAGQSIPGFPEAMSQIVGGFDMYDSVVDMSETSKTFGVRLTSLQEFAKVFIASVLSR
ncbi:MAG TPA: SDR family oxidoreductase [Candidatus Acidoferrum sp.]|nr:SDR family oxidoreductase [Candidatus Acidoferrum sp.]